MNVLNDKTCSWINDLIPRTYIKTLKSNENCDWMVVGSGKYSKFINHLNYAHSVYNFILLSALFLNKFASLIYLLTISVDL